DGLRTESKAEQNPKGKVIYDRTIDWILWRKADRKRSRSDGAVLSTARWVRGLRRRFVSTARTYRSGNGINASAEFDRRKCLRFGRVQSWICRLHVGRA